MRTGELIASLYDDFLLLCAFAVIQDIIAGVDANALLLWVPPSQLLEHSVQAE